MSICLKLSCPSGHLQIIRTQGMTREYVEQWGKLMDGTSPHVRPEDVTSIGHCRTCGGPIRAEVIDCDAGDQFAEHSETTTILYGDDPEGSTTEQ